MYHPTEIPMKKISLASICFVTLSLTACYSDTTHEKEIVHDRPVVVQPSGSPSVESTCAHGYDNSNHSCY